MTEFLKHIDEVIATAPKDSNIMIVNSKPHLQLLASYLRAIAFRCPTTQLTADIEDPEIQDYVGQGRVDLAYLDPDYSPDDLPPSDLLNQEFPLGMCIQCGFFALLVYKLAQGSKVVNIMSTDILSGDAAETKKQELQEKFMHRETNPNLSPGETNCLEN